MRYIKIFVLIYIIMNMLLCSLPFTNYSAWADSLLPQNLIVKKEFKPGTGKAVGQFRQAQGNVIVIHENEEPAYQASQNLPLYNGDRVIVNQDSHAALEMKDGSVFSLASQTNMVINESMYKPEAKKRSSFITMTLGKARFWVKKMSDFSQSNFKVRTKTAVVGVRGSDFVIESSKKFTGISTLENTRLEVVSLFSRCKKNDSITECDVKQYILNDFEQVEVGKNAQILEARPLTSAEKDQIENAFPQVPATGPPLNIPLLINAESPYIRSPYEREEENREFILNKMQEKKENLIKGELPDYPEV
ncbi:FecR family protein, partial [Desulfobacterales bacterium HSG17]|nr:FecR family protein [Desulfobacterales bacterium HSG17]